MHEHRHGPKFRPPWWPENEPFPPSGWGGWRGRGRFARRIWLFVVLFFGLTFLASGLAVAVLSGAFGLGERKGLVLPAAILGLGLLFAAFAIVGRVVRRMARPLEDVMNAADRVAGGDYSVRLDARGPREIRRLGRSFNAMTERLETGERQRRDLLADVTHELRTPLSVIQGDVEGMLDGVYRADEAHLRPVLEETKVMSRLLDDLQTLSTAEAGALRLHRQTVEPEHLVAEAVAPFRGGAESAGVQLEQRVTSGLPSVDVDPVRIGEVFSNLLVNALRHTAGGTITVEARPGPDRGTVEFVVGDTGTGIAPDDLDHVFDRFVKASDSRGAGLGLAIAKSLVEAHGGRIHADSRPDQGTVMRFVLPAAGSEA